jgi:cell division protein FtsB
MSEKAGFSYMADFLVQWVRQHIDLLKYSGLGFGFAYSCYRRLITDHREDRRQGQRDDYVEQLTGHLTAAQRREDLAHAELTRQTTENHALHAANEDLKRLVTTQQDIIDRLNRRQTETVKTPGESPAPPIGEHHEA